MKTNCVEILYFHLIRMSKSHVKVVHVKAVNETHAVIKVFMKTMSKNLIPSQVQSTRMSSTQSFIQ